MSRSRHSYRLYVGDDIEAATGRFLSNGVFDKVSGTEIRTVPAVKADGRFFLANQEATLAIFLANESRFNSLG